MIERFKLLLEELKVSPSEFADRIGVQRSNISHILSGRSKPGLDFLEKMLVVYPDIDLAWLITGIPYNRPGEMVSPGIKPESKPEEKFSGLENGFFEEKKLPPHGEEAVDQIIIVYKNNTFRILKGQ